MMILFGEREAERPPSSDATVVASNTKVINGNESEKQKLQSKNDTTEAVRSAQANTMDHYSESSKSSELEKGGSSDSPGHSHSDGQFSSRRSSSRDRRSSNRDRRNRRRSHREESEKPEVNEIESVQAPSNENHGKEANQAERCTSPSEEQKILLSETKVDTPFTKTSPRDEEKQVQKVSVVFRDSPEIVGKSLESLSATTKKKEDLSDETGPLAARDSDGLNKALNSTLDPNEDSKNLGAFQGSNMIDEADKGNGKIETDARLSEMEKRRAERKARRNKKHRAGSSNPNPAQSDVAALLGMIGSTEDDFKRKNSSSVDDLFETQPVSSVDFFKAISSIPEENDGAPSPTEERERGVIRSNSSDDAKLFNRKQRRDSRKAASAWNLLSQSDHVTDKRRNTKSLIEENNLPRHSISGATKSKNRKVEYHSNANEDGEDKYLPPPSLAGDTYVRNEWKSRRVHRAHQGGGTASVPGEDDVCEQSLAPPSLAGDIYLPRKKDQTASQAVTETIAEETDNEPVNTTLTRRMSRTAKSFAKLDCGDDDDDSFMEELSAAEKECAKKKNRAKMMDTVKKATSALDIVGKHSKGVAKKAKSARNVFEQATTKVFARSREEGKGLLRHDER
jgi:hypothetical protein